jgi:hypothetical protein
MTTKPRPKRGAFSAYEDRILRANYYTRGCAYVARALRRSKRSVQHRARMTADTLRPAPVPKDAVPIADLVLAAGLHRTLWRERARRDGVLIEVRADRVLHYVPVAWAEEQIEAQRRVDGVTEAGYLTAEQAAAHLGITTAALDDALAGESPWADLVRATLPVRRGRRLVRYFAAADVLATQRAMNERRRALRRERVSLKRLAADVNRAPRTVGERLTRLGITSELIGYGASRRACVYVTNEEADRVRAFYRTLDAAQNLGRAA